MTAKTKQCCEHGGCIETEDLIVLCHNHINTDYPCVECSKRINEKVLARWWALVDEGLLRVDSTKGISENYKSLYKAVHDKDCKVVRVKIIQDD